jgi:hypothetical protein
MPKPEMMPPEPPYRPWSGRGFGVEIELNDETVRHTSLRGSQLKQAVRSGLAKAGQPDSRLNRRQVDRYPSTGDTWDVKRDGSCGFEIATPVLHLTDAGHNLELRPIMEEINRLGPQTDARCGLHVHVDLADFNPRQLQALVRLWTALEPFFFDCCPARRLTTRFCLPLQCGQWERSLDRMNTPSWLASFLSAPHEESLQSLAAAAPRAALNLQHWVRSRRVEFRLAAGTTDYDDVRRWTMLLLTTVGRVQARHLPSVPDVIFPTSGVPPTIAVMRLLGMAGPGAAPEAPALARWVTYRRRHFNVLARATRWMARPIVTPTATNG